MNRKHLIFISPRFLFPLDSGGKIRTVNILRGMLGRNFDITLISPAKSDALAVFGTELAKVCHRFVSWPEENWIVRAMKRCVAPLARLPIAVFCDQSSAARKCIARELSRHADIVVGDFSHAAVLLPNEIPAPSVLFTHNVEAEILRRHAAIADGLVKRVLWQSQARKMKLFEDRAVRRFDGVIAVSERDASYFRTICGAERVHAIPTGIDLDYFVYTPSPEAPIDGGTIVFTGSMNWRANVDGIRFMMDSVWPAIAAARPNASMVVVGHSAPADLVRAAAVRKYRWTFTGFVEDIREFVKHANVYVMPLRVGGGTRIKAFEAMAMGCPVVSTTIGVEGLPVEPGKHCIVADSAAHLSASILNLLNDRSLATSIASNARELVETRYSHLVASNIFETACLRTINSSRRLADSASEARRQACASV